MWTALTEKTLKIEPCSLNGQNDNLNGVFPDMVGKTLMLGPSGANHDTFRIKSNTPTELTIEDGNLLEYIPPLTNWNLHVLKQKIKKQEGKDREPTEGEKRTAAQTKKKTFLIFDGEPRGT